MKYILIFLVCMILLMFCVNTLKKNYFENFVNSSNYGKKYIIDDCVNTGFGRYGNTDQQKQDICKTQAFVTNPKFLCGICGDENNPLYATGNGKDRMYACSSYASNSYGLSWLWSNYWYPKVNNFLADIQTCNTVNKGSTSNMYLYVCCDDECTIQINGKNLSQTGWNKIGIYLIENVKYNDLLTINATNLGGPGGMCISYIWNNQLFILENNGFENSANIIDFQTTNTIGWSNIWANSNAMPTLLPWMKNWINMKAGNSSYATFTCNIGNTKNIGRLTNDLTVFLGIDDSGIVNLNGKKVYNKSQSWNEMINFNVPNVNHGDLLEINCTNGGGPGGMGVCYLWCGQIFTLKNNLSKFNTVAHTIKYGVSNTNGLVYDPSPVKGNLSFLTKWLNSSCSPPCNFNFSTKIGEVDHSKPIVCGRYNFCVSDVDNLAACYGNTGGCLWGANDCTKNEDCSKYNSLSPKYIQAGLPCNTNTDNSAWVADACKA
jgi:hypothetical protein